MRKALGMLLVGLFLALMVPISVSALPGGLLDGKTLKGLFSKDKTQVVPVTEVTDGDKKTYYRLQYDSGISNNPSKIYVDLRPYSANLTAFEIDHSHEVYLELYSKGKVVFTKRVVTGYGRQKINVKDVDEIYLKYNGGDWSDVYEFDVFGTINVPRPTGVKATEDTRKVELSWTGNEGAESYTVWVDGIPLHSVTGTHCVIEDLQPEQRYKFQIQASYKNGVDSILSDPVYATTWADPLQAPDFKVQAWNDRLRISWTDNGAVSYSLYTGSSILTAGKMTAYTHTGLEKDQEYPYLLEWVDKYGRKGSMVKTFRTTLENPPPPPEPPASLQARPGHQMVTLTWARSPRDDIVGYRVYQDGKQLPGQQRGPTMDVRGLENGREYVFTVTSVSDTGEESGPSPEARATPRSEPAPGTGIDPGEIQWGFGPGDILSNGGAILLMLSSFVLLGIVVMYVKPLIGLIREAVKPG